MKKEQIKVGEYVKWVADRVFKSWNTYGKIVEANEDNFKVTTFDDGSTTELSYTGDAIKEEMRPAKKQDVEDYLESRKLNLANARGEMLLNHKKALRDLDEKIEKVNNLVI